VKYGDWILDTCLEVISLGDLSRDLPEDNNGLPVPAKERSLPPHEPVKVTKKEAS